MKHFDETTDISKIFMTLISARMTGIANSMGYCLGSFNQICVFAFDICNYNFQGTVFSSGKMKKTVAASLPCDISLNRNNKKN